jgi:peptidoglycan/LPS O-acetylase OafA/YrhL
MSSHTPTATPAAPAPARQATHAHAVGRFRALDGLRLVGALAVLSTHVGFDSGDSLRGPFAGILSRLDSGVALFFVVSGFLLFRPHAMGHLQGRSRPRTTAYLVRRAARILPVLWIAVGAAFLLLRDGRPAGDYAAHALLAQIYLGTPLTPGLTQLWSLATEVLFYLVLPLLALAACRGPRDGRWLRRLALAAGVLVLAGPAWMAVATVTGHAQARLWLPGFAGWFALGMLLAAWHAARSTGALAPGRLDVVARYPGTVWGLAAAVFLLSTTPLAGPLDLTEPTPGQAALKNLLYALLGLLVVLPTVASVPPAPEPPGVAALGSRLGAWLGEISYGVFAYHVIVLELVGRWLSLPHFGGGFWTRWLLTVAVSVAVAAASHYLVERPVMRRVRGLRVGRSSTSTTQQAAATPSQTST